jgi:hypothetical protein
VNNPSHNIERQESIRKRTAYFILTLSIVLFAFSVSQKCFCTERDCGEDWEGAALLISGVLGIGAAPVWFVWLANPVLLFSWIFFLKRIRISLTLSLVAFLICLSFLGFDKMMVDEGGNFSRITGYEAGYWIWTSSAFVLFVGNIIRMRIEKRTTAL